MTSLLSRVAIAAAGVPIVLITAYYGGWALFAVAAVAGMLALHELYRIARTLRDAGVDLAVGRAGPGDLGAVGGVEAEHGADVGGGDARGGRS